MDLFDLFAKISLDSSEYYDKLDEASNKTHAFSNKLKSGLTTAAKVGGAALAAAGAGVVAMTKQAVDNFADYEQLVGGVETLFKDSSDTVMTYAQNAYKTAGLSANQYMETVTSFSASLLQSLDGDTAKAAEKADQAITDMSDNANKMGTSMDMIQNAYNGFAKQNFTMLDNLKLGYGGTKEEMQRLLKDAEELSGTKFDISSYSDIVDAIHVVQTEMGITGTTAKEASSTISGSVASAKTAWQNLITGIADGNADLDVLMNNFVDSAGTAAGNLIPVVKTVLVNLGKMLEERGPEMVVEGVKLLGKLAVGIIQGIPQIVSKIPEIIVAIVEEFKESGPEFKEIGMDIVRGIWNGLSALASWLKEKVSGFVGGIVTNVKGKLGIHSPSRVFAGIGENMALGLGEGWGNEYGSVKNSITKGLDFGTANIDVNASAFGGAARSGGFSVAPQTFVLQLPNGDALASFMVDVLRGEARLA